jgi:hypothetical protein
MTLSKYHAGTNLPRTLHRGATKPEATTAPYHAGSGAPKGIVHAPRPQIYGTHGGTDLPRRLNKRENEDQDRRPRCSLLLRLAPSGGRGESLSVAGSPRRSAPEWTRRSRFAMSAIEDERTLGEEPPTSEFDPKRTT